MNSADIALLQDRMRQEVAAREEAERQLAEKTRELTAERAALAQERFLLQALMNNIPDHIYFKDRDSRVIRLSKSQAKLFGLADPADAVGKTDFDFFSAEHAQQARKDELEIIRSEKTLTIEEKETWPDQPDTWVSTTKVPLRDESGAVVGTFGISRSITEKKQAEEKLRLAASVFTHAREGIVITAADGTIIDVNDAFCQITGFGRDEVIGANPRVLNSGHHDAAFFSTLWRELLEHGYWSGEVWNRRKDGALFAELLTISAMRDAQGQTQQYLGLFTDITQLKRHESELEHTAHFDALTGLPNRLLLADQMRQAMAQAPRRGQKLAIAFLDLDGFKAVNDKHGHGVGDQLLAAVAARMRQVLRKGDTLARLGGDEFIAVLLDLPDEASSAPTLTRLLEAVAQPVCLADLELHISASLGVTFYPQAADVSEEQLLRQADQAMYQAKLAGKNRYSVFKIADRSSGEG